MLGLRNLVSASLHISHIKFAIYKGGVFIGER